MSYQQKYRNNPVILYSIIYSRKFLINTILFLSIPILLIPKKYLNKYKSLNYLFLIPAVIVIYLDVEDFENFLDNQPSKNTYGDIPSELN